MSFQEKGKTLTIEKKAKPIPRELQQLWSTIMSCMLECGEITSRAMHNMRRKSDFDNEDIKILREVCSDLDVIREQLFLFSQNFLESLPSTSTTSDSASQSPTIKKNTSRTQTNNKKICYHENKIPRRVCACSTVSNPMHSEKEKNETIVCSPLNETKLTNNICRRYLSKAGETKDSEVKDTNLNKKSEGRSNNDDNHPYIIKGNAPINIRGYGLGYELFCSMRRYADRVAQYIEATNESQTFAELLRDSISVALKLKAKGLNQEKIMCIYAGNTKLASIIYLAGLFIGCQMNALDLSFEMADIIFLIKLVTPNIIFVQINKLAVLEEALKQSGIELDIVVVGGEVEGQEYLEGYLEAAAEDVKKFRPHKVDSLHQTCVILFSSGTSGYPKGICLSHYNLLNQMLLCLCTNNFKKVFLSYSSFYWISNIVFLGSILLGGTVKVVPIAFSVDRFYNLIKKYKVESVFLGPYECVMLTRYPKPEDSDTSRLKVLITGGSPFKETFYLAIRKVLKGTLVLQVYGQTESSGMIMKFCSNNPEDVALSIAKPTSAGRAFGGCWYKIIDEETGDILGPGQSGELCLKSETMLMTGYYRRDSSEVYDKSGWLKTGDFAYYDDYLCFYIIDRLKEMIRYRGYTNIAPIVLEGILMTHPAVARAVVIGIPHDIDVERAMGLILLKPGIDPDSVDLNEIVEFVNTRVDEKKKLTAGVRIIKSIPFTATGKVRRRALRQSILHGDETK